MASHFRTITAVVEIDDASGLRYPGSATEAARTALMAAGFKVPSIRNGHNEKGELPSPPRLQRIIDAATRYYLSSGEVDDHNDLMDAVGAMLADGAS
jgi:hypothetical protein